MSQATSLLRPSQNWAVPVVYRIADLPPRIAAKIRVVPYSACWRWTRGHTKGGYGQVKYQRKMRLIHRLVYELLVGEIPFGLTIDHVRRRGCQFTDCCNPAHLEPVTQLQNLMRGNTVNARNAAKTHCPKGHPLIPGNLLRPGGNRSHHRHCLTCRRDRARESRAALKGKT